MGFPFDIEVVYEDDDVVAVSKPTGLTVHPAPRKVRGKRRGNAYEYTLVDWLLARYRQIEGVGEPWRTPDGVLVPRPGIVHRLDRETSGVLVVAKTPEAFAHLKEQFQQRLVEKIYHAFVYGTPRERQGTIDRPIGKSAKDFRLRSAQPGARGTLRDARTDYTVMKTCEDASYLEVRPQTGRTHQIRVHLKAIHHPVVCDRRYAPKRACILGFSRLALHASVLSFRTLTGERLTVASALPADFTQALARCG